MSSSNDYGIPHRPDAYQAVLNSSWPPADVARALKDRPYSIPVGVRVTFDRDGEQWLNGMARRWWQRNVCVEVDDRRLRVRYIWVDAADVRRLAADR